MFFWESVAFAMGAAPQGDGQAGGNPITAFAPLIIMFVIFYFLLIRPQQKKAKQHRELLANITRGDHVITGGGIYGRVTATAEEVLTIEIAKEVEIKVNRSYVSNVVNPDKSPKTPEEKKAKAKDTPKADAEKGKDELKDDN